MQTDFGLRHWLVALGIALACHALAGLAFEPSSPGATGTGSGGIYLNLGGNGGSGIGSGGAPLQISRGVPAAESAARPQKKPTAAEPLPKPNATPKSEPDKKPDVTERQAVQTETPSSNQKTPPQTAATTTALSEKNPIETAPGNAVTKTGTAGAGGGGDRLGGGGKASGNGSASAGFGSGGGSPTYLTVLRAWLEAHKQYPPLARARNQAGDVTISFVLHADGRLTDANVAESSGFSILDQA
ncbi:MAG TPA: TonB family protein, partial [Gammaproteobacteria bacterium]|nr:TonB family protein [Gammaproteobacteria bacterium]